MAPVMASTPSAQYSLTLRVEIDHLPGMLGKVASAIGDAGGTIGAVDLVLVEGSHTIRDITVETGDAVDRRCVVVDVGMADDERRQRPQAPIRRHARPAGHPGDAQTDSAWRPAHYCR